MPITLVYKKENDYFVQNEAICYINVNVKTSKTCITMDLNCTKSPIQQDSKVSPSGGCNRNYMSGFLNHFIDVTRGTILKHCSDENN